MLSLVDAPLTVNLEHAGDYDRDVIFQSNKAVVAHLLVQELVTAMPNFSSVGESPLATRTQRVQLSDLGPVNQSTRGWYIYPKRDTWLPTVHFKCSTSTWDSWLTDATAFIGWHHNVMVYYSPLAKWGDCPLGHVALCLPGDSGSFMIGPYSPLTSTFTATMGYMRTMLLMFKVDPLISGTLEVQLYMANDLLSARIWYQNELIVAIE